MSSAEQYTARQLRLGAIVDRKLCRGDSRADTIDFLVQEYGFPRADAQSVVQNMVRALETLPHYPTELVSDHQLRLPLE
jgi:hypothetical protein